MENVENLFNKAVGEIERMLNSSMVVGEPITVDGNTLIPLLISALDLLLVAVKAMSPKKVAGTVVVPVVVVE